MDYKTCLKASKKYNETNDCAVIAVAIVLGTSYEDAHGLLKQFGRKDRGSTSFDKTTLSALISRGFQVNPKFVYNPMVNKRWSIKEFENSQLIRRFKHPVLILTRGHILAVKNGKVEDFTSGRNHQIKAIWEVVPTDHSIYSLPAKPIESIVVEKKTKKPTYALIHQKTQKVYKKYKRFPNSLYKRTINDPMGLWIRNEKSHTQGQLVLIKL